MCAVGRYLEDSYSSTLEEHPVSDIFNLLPDKLQELGLNFLWCMQTFHDRECNWFNDGISNTGLSHYDRIKKDIEKGVYI
jgi:hypothetical protein